MSSRRFQRGDMNPVLADVDGSHLIEAYDLLWQRGDFLAFSYQTLAELVHENHAASSFAARFLGVALDRFPRGEAGQIRVATTGIFCYEAPRGGTWRLGQLVAAIGNQTIDLAAHVNQAIARVVRGGPGSHEAHVSICSTVMAAGIWDRRRAA